MPLNQRDRHKTASRRKAFRKGKPRVLVVTEGEVTEPEYLEQFAVSCKNPLVNVVVATDHGNDPKSMVGIAKELWRKSKKAARNHEDSNLGFESVWCVFDIDDHKLIPEAKQMAVANNINLAISNPSFELWLLLHLRDCPGMQHRDKIREMLKDLVPSYDKHVEYQLFADGYAEAVRRAEKMDELAADIFEEGRNPTTGVYRLTSVIRGAE